MKNIHVENYFDHISTEYKSNFNIKKSSKNYTFIKRKRIATSLLSKRSGNFLDIATGSGEITSAILNKNKFKKITLIDISTQMLNKVKIRLKNKKKYSKVEFINSDFSKLRLNFKYDYIICLGILAHFPSNRIFFNKLKRFSKKGTIILLQSSLLNFPTIKINKILFSKRYKKKFKYKLNYITEKNLNKFFKKNGFMVLEVKRYSLAIPILDKLFPTINYYIDLLFDKIFPNNGSEGIFLLKKL